jgi:hypothetical protein
MKTTDLSEFDQKEDAVAETYKKDIETQEKYGVKYLEYWYNDHGGRVICLVEAPDKESAVKVHREVHGLLTDDS